MGFTLLTPTVPLIGCYWHTGCAFEKSIGCGVSALARNNGSRCAVLAIPRPVRVMMEHVATGEIDYQTLYTAHNSWLALQIRSMPS
jgi:hypothetical protein